MLHVKACCICCKATRNIINIIIRIEIKNELFSYKYMI